jgi:cell wall-associated NlpC family hydrolase
MIEPSRAGRWLWSLAAWTAGIGLAWLLLGHQYAGQPAVHLDLAAGLPGAATLDRQAPTLRPPTPAPHRQHSPSSSTGTATPHATAAAPPPPHAPATSPRTSTGSSQAAARAVVFALSQRGKPYQWSAPKALTATTARA